MVGRSFRHRTIIEKIRPDSQKKSPDAAASGEDMYLKSKSRDG